MQHAWEQQELQNFLKDTWEKRLFISIVFHSNVQGNVFAWFNYISRNIAKKKKKYKNTTLLENPQVPVTVMARDHLRCKEHFYKS